MSVASGARKNTTQLAKYLHVLVLKHGIRCMYKGIVSWNGDLEKRELYHSELWADMSILNAKLLIIIKFHVLQDLR